MNITDLLLSERVSCCNDVGSKKRLLEYISELLAASSPGISQNDIVDALICREKLGSTGLGKGVAIPHGRITHLEQPVCAFVKLATPVDFDATDGQPVDLVFALLVPEDIFSNTGICMALRQCDTDSCLLEQRWQWEARRISA